VAQDSIYGLSEMIFQKVLGFCVTTAICHMGFMVIAHTTRSERMADSVKKTDALVALNFVAGWVRAKCIGTDEMNFWLVD
jgi:hypothetical protein